MIDDNFGNYISGFGCELKHDALVEERDEWKKAYQIEYKLKHAMINQLYYMIPVKEKAEAEVEKLTKIIDAHTKLYPANEWGEDDGDCLWWKLPIEEPPYCGTPLDCEFTKDYYTHFQKILQPEEKAGGEG